MVRTTPEHKRKLAQERIRRFHEKHPDYNQLMYRRHLAKRKRFLAENRERILHERAAYREANRARLNARDRERRKAWPFWKRRYEKSLEKANRNGAVVIDRAALLSYYQRVFTQDAATCDYCRGVFAIREIVIDHKQPYALGGCHVVTNLMISCFGCNRRKNATPYDKWVSQPERDHAGLAD